jgi:hypothetical protein
MTSSSNIALTLPRPLPALPLWAALAVCAWLAAIAAVGYELWQLSYAPTSGGAAIAELAAQDGTARVRAPASIIWDEAHRAQPLHDGDLVATGPAATATIRFKDGREVTLGAGSMIEISMASSTEDATGHLRLELLKGSVVTPPGRGVTVSASGRTFAAPSAGGSQLVVGRDSVTGQVRAIGAAAATDVAQPADPATAAQAAGNPATDAAQAGGPTAAQRASRKQIAPQPMLHKPATQQQALHRRAIRRKPTPRAPRNRTIRRTPPPLRRAIPPRPPHSSAPTQPPHSPRCKPSSPRFAPRAQRSPPLPPSPTTSAA